MRKTLWPVILIIVGIMLLLNAILPFRLPVFQVLIALFCVWIGITMFTGNERGESSGDDDEVDERPTEGTYATGIYTTEEKKNKREYNCVFSSTNIDLTRENELPEKIEINCVFSSARVRLPVDYNVTVQANSAFGSVSLPNTQNLMLGENKYHYGSQDPSAPKLKVKINCAFGSLTCNMG